MIKWPLRESERERQQRGEKCWNAIKSEQTKESINKNYKNDVHKF